MPFQYTFRADDITTWEAETRDLIENRDRELELSLIDLNGANPIGGIVMWGGEVASIPSNYVLCNGASVLTSVYPSLFAALQYRYGGSGANFNLPNFTTRIPIGTAGTPTPPSTIATNAATVVDVHTHTVNSSLALGTLNTHTHAGGVLTAGSVNSSFTAGNAQNHTHGVNATTGNGSVNHTHVYFKPNAGANNNTDGQGAAHTHSFNTTSSGSNTTITVNSSFTAGNTNTSITAPGAPNATINTALTAGNASTINASTPAHSHLLNTIEVVFIIRFQ